MDETPQLEFLATPQLGKSNVNAHQVGGKHYQHLDPAPWDVITQWNLGYLDGTAIKYLARWRKKNGIEDLRKAIHFIEKLIEVESKSAAPPTAPVEQLNNSLFDGYKNLFECHSPRLRYVHDVASAAGDSIPVPTGELNDVTILREDNV